jgi:hypothetical protein
MHTLGRHSLHEFQFETRINIVEINNITIYYMFSELYTRMCDQSAFSHSWRMFSVPTSRTLQEGTYYCCHALHFSVYGSLNSFYILSYTRFTVWTGEKMGYNWIFNYASEIRSHTTAISKSDVTFDMFVFHAIVHWFGTTCVHLCDFSWFSEICICVGVAVAVYEIGMVCFSRTQWDSSWIFNSPASQLRLVLHFWMWTSESWNCWAMHVNQSMKFWFQQAVLTCPNDTVTWYTYQGVMPRNHDTIHANWSNSC